MASDQGKWFKVWTSFPTDEKVGDLSLEDIGRWVLFGAYLKLHGANGSITVRQPCYSLTNLLRVSSFDALLDAFRRMPNCDVTGETNVTVTWRNWPRYQQDSSSERVRRFRQRETAKKRREEKRREEKRSTPKPPQAGADFDGFSRFWKAYPKKVGKGAAEKAWRKLRPGGNTLSLMLSALDWQRRSDQWTKESGQFIPNPSTYLNQRRWEDEPERQNRTLADILGETDAAD